MVDYYIVNKSWQNRENQKKIYNESHQSYIEATYAIFDYV